MPDRARVRRVRRPAATHVAVGALALLTSSTSSFGAPARPVPVTEPPLPPPELKLTVAPGVGGAPWRLRIENKSEGPVRIPADPRLLVLELAPASAASPENGKAKKGVPPAAPRCVLPDDARPFTDDVRELVLPPARSWSATFDPLFHCFGARERAALVAGTVAPPRFGWPAAPSRDAKAQRNAKGAPKAPFAATPVGVSTGRVAALKAIDGESFTLGEAVTAPVTSSPEDPASAGLVLRGPDAVDVARGREIATTISLANGSERPISLLYRSDQIQFGVTGPAGLVVCGLPRTVAAPIRELFATVAVGARVDTNVLVTTACPPGTFDDAGVYRVVPRLDTTGTSGRTIGLRTWDGLVVAKTPVLVRVRSSRKLDQTRPTLD